MSTALDKAIAKCKQGELVVKLGERVVKNEEHIPKAETKATPTLSLKNATGSSSASRYLVISLDLDAPFPSFHFLSPIWHWLQSDITPSADNDGSGGVNLTASATPPAANWLAANPPPMSGPHRYIFMLYEQPGRFNYEDFAPPNGKEMGIGPRVKWSLDAFEKKVGLGEIVAGAIFTSN